MKVNIQTYQCSRCGSNFAAMKCPKCGLPRLMNATEAKDATKTIKMPPVAEILTNTAKINIHKAKKTKSGEFYQSTMVRKDDGRKD